MGKIALVKGFLLYAALALLAYFNIRLWQSAYFGWFIFLLFLVFCGGNIHRVLVNFFGLSKHWRIKIISIFIGWSVFGCVSGAMNIVFGYTSLTSAVSLFFCGVVCLLAGEWARPIEDEVPQIENEFFSVLEQEPILKIGVLSFLFLEIIGFYLLLSSRTGIRLDTPWQAINSWYIFAFFLATLLLGYLIFSGLKIKVAIIFLFIHSFLLHSYLPITHDFIYGADGWRHMAVEKSIIENGFEKIADITDQASMFDVGKIAYAQFHAQAIFANQMLQIDLVEYMKWSVPIVWSLVFVLLVFEISLVLGADKRKSLFVAWFLLFPFALQASGSFTLPSNTAFLSWLCGVLMILKLSEKWNRNAWLFLILFGLQLFFAHTLFFVLFWVAFLVYTISRQTKNILVAFFVAAIIPSLEIVFGYSKISKLNFLLSIKNIIGNFSGYFLTIGPMTRDITTGNVFFNQAPSYAFVENVFTKNTWVVPVFMVAFFSIFIIAFRKYLASKNNPQNVFVLLSASLFLSYVISRYFLSGENILARRMDSTLAVLISTPIAIFLADKIFSFNRGNLYLKIFPYLILLFISFACAISYSLGPDSRVVSRDEYSAANLVYGLSGNKPCIVGDVFVLLPIEFMSSKDIIGGGFPINSNFAQPEKEEILVKARENKNIDWVSAKKITGAEDCYLIGDFSFTNQMAQFGKIRVFKF